MQSQEKEGWGAKIINQLSMDLRAEFPDMKGFSPQNLKYMRKFAMDYDKRFTRTWDEPEIDEKLDCKKPSSGHCGE